MSLDYGGLCSLGPKPKVVDHPVVTTSADVVPLTAD
jgi:hypothetical protein